MSLTIGKPPIDSQQVVGNFTKVVVTTLVRVPDLMEVEGEGRNYQEAKSVEVKLIETSTLLELLN